MPGLSPPELPGYSQLQMCQMVVLNHCNLSDSCLRLLSNWDYRPCTTRLPGLPGSRNHFGLAQRRGQFVWKMVDVRMVSLHSRDRNIQAMLSRTRVHFNIWSPADWKVVELWGHGAWLAEVGCWELACEGYIHLLLPASSLSGLLCYNDMRNVHCLS